MCDVVNMRGSCLTQVRGWREMTARVWPCSAVLNINDAGVRGLCLTVKPAAHFCLLILMCSENNV